MLKLVLSKKFERDLKKLKKRNYDIHKLEEVVEKIRKQEILEARYRNHKLKGNYSGYMECHIEPDWLLVYKIENDILILTLSRTGTHADLFNK